MTTDRSLLDKIQDYIQKKLDPAEEQAFEEWMIQNPDSLEDLELDLYLQQGIAELYGQEISTTQASNDPESFAGRSKRLTPLHVGFAAASVVLAFSLALLVQSHLKQRDLTERLNLLTAPNAQVVRIPLSAARSQQQADATIRISGPRRLLLFELLVPKSDRRYSSYLLQSSIAGAQSDPENVVPARDPSGLAAGVVTVAVDSAAATSGLWEFSLYGAAAGSPELIVAFRANAIRD